MTDKELNSEPNEEEFDIVDDYTIGFATYLMQKRCDERRARRNKRRK